jgi:hypothetical protein
MRRVVASDAPEPTEMSGEQRRAVRGGRSCDSVRRAQGPLRSACVLLNSLQARFSRTLRDMDPITLQTFISVNREEIVRRCRTKVATRSSPPPTEAEIEHGVPVFLDQLLEEFRHGPSKLHEINLSAVRHGHELLLQGFTVGQVVHDYGDVCQSVTDLAVETQAPIAAADFRTLNRCLDDAIAGAVTEYARTIFARDGASQQLSNLTDTAITAFEVLRTGSVGIGGSTGTVLKRSLQAIRALLDRPLVAIAGPESR